MVDTLKVTPLAQLAAVISRDIGDTFTNSGRDLGRTTTTEPDAGCTGKVTVTALNPGSATGKNDGLRLKGVRRTHVKGAKGDATNCVGSHTHVPEDTTEFRASHAQPELSTKCCSLGHTSSSTVVTLTVGCVVGNAKSVAVVAVDTTVGVTVNPHAGRDRRSCATDTTTLAVGEVLVRVTNSGDTVTVVGQDAFRST